MGSRGGRRRCFAPKDQGHWANITAVLTRFTNRWRSIGLEGADRRKGLSGWIKTGQYTEVLSNSVGTVVSAVATLTVVPPPFQIVDGGLADDGSFHFKVSAERNKVAAVARVFGYSQ